MPPLSNAVVCERDMEGSGSQEAFLGEAFTSRLEGVPQWGAGRTVCTRHARDTVRGPQLGLLRSAWEVGALRAPGHQHQAFALGSAALGKKGSSCPPGSGWTSWSRWAVGAVQLSERDGALWSQKDQAQSSSEASASPSCVPLEGVLGLPGPSSPLGGCQEPCFV